MHFIYEQEKQSMSQKKLYFMNNFEKKYYLKILCFVNNNYSIKLNFLYNYFIQNFSKKQFMCLLFTCPEKRLS